MKALAADSIQAAIRAEGLDGWLFYSFRGSDPIAENILRLDNARLATRRWFYFVPASGSPRKIVHAIESEMLDSLPGEKMVYLPWQQLHQHLRDALGDSRRIAIKETSFSSTSGRNRNFHTPSMTTLRGRVI
jgi:Xaa-Pro dipeptidase